MHPERASAPADRGSDSSGIALLAVVILAGNVLSRLLGLAREQIAASRFGTGDAIAAFTVADNVQTIVFDLMISGALQAALIPVLTQLTLDGTEDRRAFRRAGGVLVMIMTLVLGVLTVTGIVLAPHVVRGLTWFGGEDRARNAETVELTIRLVRITLPAALLLSVGTLLQAMLYALNKVGAPSFSSAVRNLAIVAAALTLGSRYGVESMAWGTVAGAALILVMQLVPLSRSANLPILNLDLQHPALGQILTLYIPVFLGLLVSTAAVVVDRGLAWGAGENALGAMRYATALVQLALGLVAAAIGLAALPSLSRHYAGEDLAAFRHTLGRALTMVAILMFPATFGLAALAHPISSLLFGYGATDNHGVGQITIALLGYLPGALAAAFDQVLIFAFYARQNTRVPVIVGVLAVGVYFAVAWALVVVGPFGMTGLVLANSAQFVFHALAMYWLTRKRFGWTATLRLRAVAPICAFGAIALAAVAVGCWWGLDQILPVGSVLPAEVARRLILVILPATLGGIVYLVVIWRTCGAMLVELTASIRARLPLPPFGR